MINSFIECRRAVALLLALVCAGPALAEDHIEAAKAPFHVGKTVLACGQVAEVNTRGKATYINLDRPFPGQSLGLVVWQSDLPGYQARFGDLSTLRGRRVCARGLVEDYRNRLQMVLRNPQFLRVMGP